MSTLPVIFCSLTCLISLVSFYFFLWKYLPIYYCLLSTRLKRSRIWSIMFIDITSAPKVPCTYRYSINNCWLNEHTLAYSTYIVYTVSMEFKLRVCKTGLENLPWISGKLWIVWTRDNLSPASLAGARTSLLILLWLPLSSSHLKVKNEREIK